MNKDTLRIINSLGLEPDGLRIFDEVTLDDVAADSLFHNSTKYTDIGRLVTSGMMYEHYTKKFKQELALNVKGEFSTKSTRETFSVTVGYFPLVWEGEIESGERVHEKYGTIILIMNRGLKRLEDYLFKCQAAQQSQCLYTYRSRTEIKP